MKIKFLFLSLLMITCISGNARSSSRLDFEIKFNIILNSLDSVIDNSENQHETLVEHYTFIKDKIYDNSLTVEFDSTLNYDFFGCGGFNVSKDDPGDVSLSYGQYVADIYDHYPTLAYAILINTFQSAYDYYNNKELFLISMSNEIEQTFFKMDALMLEAIFLYVYMKDSPKLGYVEKYLISDLQQGMNGSATLFLKTDLELLHTINNLSSEERSSKILLKEYKKIGDDLLKNISFESDNKWTNYCSIITLKTYIFYSKQVIFDIVHLKDGISQDMFDIKNYSDNFDTITKIQNVIKSNSSFLKFHNETMKMYSDSYTN